MKNNNQEMKRDDILLEHPSTSREQQNLFKLSDTLKPRLGCFPGADFRNHEEHPILVQTDR